MGFNWNFISSVPSRALHESFVCIHYSAVSSQAIAVELDDSSLLYRIFRSISHDTIGWLWTLRSFFSLPEISIDLFPRVENVVAHFLHTISCFPFAIGIQFQTEWDAIDHLRGNRCWLMIALERAHENLFFVLRDYTYNNCSFLHSRKPAAEALHAFSLLSYFHRMKLWENRWEQEIFSRCE